MGLEDPERKKDTPFPPPPPKKTKQTKTKNNNTHTHTQKLPQNASHARDLGQMCEMMHAPFRWGVFFFFLGGGGSEGGHLQVSRVM